LLQRPFPPLAPEGHTKAYLNGTVSALLDSMDNWLLLQEHLRAIADQGVGENIPQSSHVEGGWFYSKRKVDTENPGGDIESF
jgi:hypothetical protein